MRVTVVGAGAWGLALARHLSKLSSTVFLWARDPARARAANAGLPIVESLTDAVARADLVVSAVPSYATRAVWRDAARALPSGAIWVSAAKGIENESLLTMTELFLALSADTAAPVAALSGPSFAKEVARGLPTAVVAAAADETVARTVQGAFAGPAFRVYTSTDVVGVELGGALKNVVAIAAGTCDGLGLGANARAALITRGLAEMARLAIARGANALTLAGLSGLGDLVLTCTGELSRNRAVGLRLGRGENASAVLTDLHEAVEGVRTVRSVCALASREKVEMPVARAVHAMLYEGLAPSNAVASLMGREMRPELT